MKDIDEKMIHVKEELDCLEYRTKIENQAIALISQCRFQEAQELLKTI